MSPGAPPDEPTHEPTFAIERRDGTLSVTGELRTREAAAIWHKLHAETRGTSTGTLAIDLSGAHTIDGAVMALLVAFDKELTDRGVRAEMQGTPEGLRPLAELYGEASLSVAPGKRRSKSTIEQIGRATTSLGEALAGTATFLGALVASLGGVFERRRSGRLDEVPQLIERTGVNAVLFVAFINFLVGIVMANQAASQASGPLAVFGAQLFLADIVGLTMTRELTPLITAVIVCGWSGAAFTAEIGAMKIAGEIDALRTFGLRPFGWLAVPRIVALLIVTPALTIIGDVIGIFGGLAYAVTTQGLTAKGYFLETQRAVEVHDVTHGLIKSVVFALAIGLISCQQGFAASGGAEGVGRRTTSSVVRSLFAIVVLDALFTLAFDSIGW